MTVDVLGTEYSITETTATDDAYLNDMDGYCGPYNKINCH